MKSLRVLVLMTALAGMFLLAACGNGDMKDTKSAGMKQTDMVNKKNMDNKKGDMNSKSSDMKQNMKSSNNMKKH